VDLLRGLKKAFLLTSGGKDSILAGHLAKEEGIELKGLITLIPEDKESWLFHTYNLNWVSMIAKSMNLDLILTKVEKGKELEGLKDTLKGLDMDLLVTGGVSSNYQRLRFSEACKAHNIDLYSPLWGKRGEEVYNMILERNMKVMVIAVAAYGLDDSWLGRILDREGVKKLIELSKKYGFDPIGEGGDLDTFVLKAPLYRYELKVKRYKKFWYGDRGFLEIEDMEFS